MIGHLGDRVSALLDGQLSSAEEERAWAHVHACHQCRDVVEREGWVKTRLAGLSFDAACAPSSLKGSLMASLSAGLPPGVGIAAVSTIGWLGFLAGPPAIGFAASLVGLRTALAIVVISTSMVALLARSAAPARPGRATITPRIAQAGSRSRARACA